MKKIKNYYIQIPCVNDCIEAFISAESKQGAKEKALQYFDRTIYNLGGLYEDKIKRFWEEINEDTVLTMEDLEIILNPDDETIDVYEIDDLAKELKYMEF